MNDDPIYKVSDPEVLKANFAADPGYRLVCRECGKTPQHIGRCKDCGYNRPYEQHWTGHVDKAIADLQSRDRSPWEQRAYDVLRSTFGHQS